MAPFDGGSSDQLIVTIEHVIGRIKADRTLSPTRRRDLLSCLNRFCVLLGLTPETTEASFVACRAALKRFSPAAGQITDKTWSTVRSAVTHAFDTYGVPYRPNRPNDLSAEWRSLRRTLSTSTISLDRGLARFIHYCNGQGIPPDAVTDETANQFLHHVRSRTSVAKPEQIYRDTCKLWNHATSTVPGWPTGQLTVPSYRKRESLDWTDFPPSFYASVEAWRAVVSGETFDHPNAPDKALSPETIRFRLYHIRRYASALVATGVPTTQITDLTEIVRPDYLERGVGHLRKRLGKTAYLFELVVTLSRIGKHWAKLSEDDLRRVTTLRKKLKCRRKGLTQGNRAVLLQFNDPRNVHNLTTLPHTLIAAARRQPSQRKAALLMQTALAVQILLVAPIRLKNLINLDQNKHFDFTQPGRRGVAHLVIVPEEVKNDFPLEFELPEFIVELLKLYIRKYLPILAPIGSGYLFPGASAGRRKHEVTIRGQITKAIRRYTGLRLHVHGFRHVAAKLFLDQYPDKLPLVSFLLGHKSIQTTIDFYAELQTKAASRIYQRNVLKQPFSYRPGRRRS